MKPAALGLCLAACIGAPDRATLEGGHGWGSSDGEIGGSKAVEQDGSSQWIGVGIQFPITYPEEPERACLRCADLALRLTRAEQQLARAPESAPAEGGGVGGLWIGSGAVATLGAALAALQRLGVVPPIRPRNTA